IRARHKAQVWEVWSRRFVEEHARTHSRVDYGMRLTNGQKYAPKIVLGVSGGTNDDRNRLKILRQLFAANTMLRFSAHEFSHNRDMRLECGTLVLVRKFADGPRQPLTGVVGWLQP